MKKINKISKRQKDQLDTNAKAFGLAIKNIIK